MGALKFDLNIINQSVQSPVYLSLPQKDFVEHAISYLYRFKKNRYDFSAYCNSVRHFMSYQTSIGCLFQTNEVGCEVLEEFAYYLQEIGLKQNTVAGMIQRIKFLLSKAYKNGWAVNNSYEDAKIKNEETFAIALDKRDISNLYYLKGLTKSEDHIRYLFVFQCCSGLRYSDLRRVGKEHISGNFIKMRTQKTKSPVCIYMNDYIKEIFARYDYELPKAPSSQYYNRKLKEICRKAGMTNLIHYEVVKNGSVEMECKEKCELVASHTARRTFITNNAKDQVPLDTTQKATGHKSLDCVAGYNKMKREESAMRMAFVSI